MKDKLAKMMGEKKKLSPIEQKAKMGVLEQLKKDMQGMMGEKVAGLKKVTVASNDKHGLEEGLDKAKSMIHGGVDDVQAPESDDEKDAEDQDGSDPLEEPEEEQAEHTGHMEMALGHAPGEESEEELDAKIQELLKKKAAMKK